MQEDAGGFLWWRDIILSLTDYFRLLAVPSVHKGDTALFWKDQWDLGLLRQRFAKIFSYAKHANCSVNEVLLQW
jgi:hypothetical protein